MTQITAKMVKELRESTGAGILDSKKALEQADGNFDTATQILREKGMAKMAKRASREANEGLIEMYAHPGNRVGVMLELNCETDFVARNEQFRELAHDIALQIAAMDPRYVDIEDVPSDDLDAEREVLRTQALNEGKPERIVERMVEGRMQKFYADYVLLEQPFVKNGDVKIRDLIANAIGTIGENIVVRRFVRYELGE